MTSLYCDRRGGDPRAIPTMDIVRLTAFNPSAYTGRDGNNTYLVRGRESVLIDAGVGDPRHLDAIAEALAGARLRRVLVTHAHPDHASGASRVAARWPGAEFLKMPWPEHDHRFGVHWTPLVDGDEVPAGDTLVRTIHTPGHAPDHLCFFDPASGTLFSGDLAVSGTTVVIPGSYGGRLSDYLRSLRRILDLAPARLLPAHGPVIERPADLLRSYLMHRQEREDQVIEALTSGCTTPAEIVRRIYVGLVPALVDAAAESVLAHLIKLEQEGRARRDESGGWRLMTGGANPPE